MLKQLSLDNLTVFSRVQLDFASGINVIVGANGTGKTHLLKVAYSLMATSAELGRGSNEQSPTKTALQKAYANKLLGTFKPDALGRLVQRKQGRSRCEIACHFADYQLNATINFATNAKNEVQIKALPEIWEANTPLYIPTRELMTLYPGFVALYEQRYVPFEETWRDTCLHLGMTPLKGRRSKAMADMLDPLEKAMGGRVVLEKNGQFYLQIPGSGNMEMHLVAEGLRKLAMLAQLISNGTLQEQRGYLFWDEPDANLNPHLIRLVARVIHALGQQGVQVFIATHSYFLLKELEILSKEENVNQAWFALYEGEDGGIEKESAENLTMLEHIVALEEEIAQYDRELELMHG